MVEYQHPLKKYIRETELPTIFCPGCASGQVLSYTLRAIDELQYNLNDFVLFSGGGCNCWIPPVINTDSIHAIHGRPIPIAMGVKIARPELKMIVFTGDGDSAAIGANHLIQAARRNVEMLVLCINNGNFGMTGGQVSPTTPENAYTTTSPYGNIEKPFDLCNLVAAAGASFVARWTTYHARQLIGSIKKGIEVKGFAFIDVISQCPTQFGRRLGFESSASLMKWFKDKSVLYKGKDGLGKLSNEEIPVGEFVDEQKELGFVEKLNKLIHLSNEGSS